MQCVENTSGSMSLQAPEEIMCFYYFAVQALRITLSARDFGRCGADLTNAAVPS